MQVVRSARAVKPGPLPVLLVPGPDGVAGLRTATGTTGIPGAPAENASLAARIAAIPGVTAYVLSGGDPRAWVGDSDGSGPAAAAAIDCLHQGGWKVAVVAASTGGLAAQWALTEAGGAQERAGAVAVAATVGTPSSGAYAVDVARALRSDDPATMPEASAADAARNGFVARAAMADAAACPSAGGKTQHESPACRRLDVLAALAGGLGDALAPGTSIVDSMAAWPAQVPVLRIAARGQVSQRGQRIDIGDGVSSVDSVLAGAKRGAVHTCPGLTTVGDVPTPCWNSDLATFTEAVDDAVGVVRAFAHPTMTAAAGTSGTVVVENGQTISNLPAATTVAADANHGAFSADGRFFVVNDGSRALSVVDLDTGAKRSLSCSDCAFALAGRQIYLKSDKDLTVYSLSDLRPRPAGFGVIGRSDSYLSLVATRGEQVIVDMLDNDGATNGDPSLVAIGPGGARTKVAKLPTTTTTFAVHADPYDPRGGVTAVNNSHVDGCSNLQMASTVDFATGAVKPVDGSAFGLSAKEFKAADATVDYTEITDVHRGADGRTYAIARSGSCEYFNRSDMVESSLWRLDGGKWSSVDARPILADRSFGAAGRLTVTGTKDLVWKRGSVSHSYGGYLSLFSPPGQSVFADPSMAPPGGRKVKFEKLTISPDGIGSVKIGATRGQVLATGLAKEQPGSSPQCPASVGVGALQGVRMVFSADGRLRTMYVDKARYVTDDGMRATATVADLKLKYGSSLKMFYSPESGLSSYYVTRGPNMLAFQVLTGTDFVRSNFLGTTTAVLDKLQHAEGPC